MPQITKTSLVLALLCWLLALTLAGCGDTNSRSDYEPERGEHPDGWVATRAAESPSGHAVAARGHFYTCTPCHGSNLEGGGISRTSCAECHPVGTDVTGGTGSPVSDVHPWGWGQFAYALHSQYVRTNGTAECSAPACHGTTLEGGAGPSCSSCHLGGPLRTHPLEWDPPVFTRNPNIPEPTILPEHGEWVNANGAARCTIPECHGSATQGIIPTGRSCRACHY